MSWGHFNAEEPPRPAVRPGLPRPRRRGPRAAPPAAPGPDPAGDPGGAAAPGGAGPLYARARRLAGDRAEHRRVGLRPARVGGLPGGGGGIRHTGLADPPRAPAE